MTEWDAKLRALEISDLDDFQKIAVADLLDDLKGFAWPPEPGSEHERKLIALGAIIGERLPMDGTA